MIIRHLCPHSSLQYITEPITTCVFLIKYTYQQSPQEHPCRIKFHFQKVFKCPTLGKTNKTNKRMQQQKKYKQTQPLKTKAHERKRMYGWYEQVSNIL